MRMNREKTKIKNLIYFEFFLNSVNIFIRKVSIFLLVFIFLSTIVFQRNNNFFYFFFFYFFYCLKKIFLVYFFFCFFIL
jgi:hypothetical protein